MSLDARYVDFLKENRLDSDVGRYVIALVAAVVSILVLVVTAIQIETGRKDSATFASTPGAAAPPRTIEGMASSY